ncbi:MAG: hypothetical protein ACFFAJ_07370 [Candidatus Hodarchaeota archaeon]
MTSKVKNLVFFDLKRISSPVLFFSIIPIILLINFILYLYITTSVSSLITSDRKVVFQLTTRLFIFLLQFILTLYTISLSIYLFHDPTVVFLITGAKSRVIPYFSRVMTSIVITLFINIIFILIYSFFSIFFLQVIPSFQILSILIFVSGIEAICFIAITFFGYSLFNFLKVNPILSSLFPISFLFIIPQFVYSGISFGVFPVFLYELTYQYHLSAIANFLLPSPYNGPLALNTALFSISIIIFTIIIAFLGSFIIIKKSEYY